MPATLTDAGRDGLTSTRSSIIRICAFFVGAYAVMLAGAAALEGTWVAQALMKTTAITTSCALRLMGSESHVEEMTVISSLANAEIIYECTAIFPAALLVAGILSFPTRLSAKAVGVGFGLPAMFILNEVRLVSLLYVRAYLPSQFETAHLVVWPVLLVVIVTGGWLAWAVHALPTNEAYQR